MDNSQAAGGLTGMKKHMPYVFSFVAFGQGFGVILILQFLSYYCTEFLGMTLAQVALVLSICNIADWAFTFITGPIVQKTNTKWGQFRPYVLIAPMLILLGYFLIFVGIQASTTVITGIIIACYGGTGFCWQVLSASNAGLLSKVAGASADNRLSITSKNQVTARVAGICTSMATAPVLQSFTDRGQNGYLVLTIIYGLLGIIPNILLFVMTKEYDVYNPDFKAPTSTSNVKVSEMYMETLKNPQFLAIFIAAIVSAIGTQAVQPLNTYYWRYSIGNFSLQALQGTISMFVNLGAAALIIPVAKRLGKKKSAVISRFLVAIVNILVAFFTDGNFVMKVILVSSSTLFGAMFMAWGINYYLDVAEYQEYKTGKDMKAFVVSMSNMTARMGGVIGAPIGMWLLGNVGYDQVEKTMENTFLLCLFIGLAPALTGIISGLIYQFAYKLTDEQAAEYALHNQREREKKAAALAAAADSSE